MKTTSHMMKLGRQGPQTWKKPKSNSRRRDLNLKTQRLMRCNQMPKVSTKRLVEHQSRLLRWLQMMECHLQKTKQRWKQGRRNVENDPMLPVRHHNPKKGRDHHRVDTTRRPHHPVKTLSFNYHICLLDKPVTR